MKEIEEYSPRWLLNKINGSKTEAEKLMNIISFQDNLTEIAKKCILEAYYNRIEAPICNRFIVNTREKHKR